MSDDEVPVGDMGEFGVLDIDWGADADVTIESSCDLENPESCESCQ